MSISVGVRITGIKEARALYAKMAQGAVSWQRSRVGVGSDLPYADPWIERGFYFTRPGRTRAVHYFERAMAAVLPTVGARILNALPGGGSAVSAEAQKISNELAEKAQQFVTVRSGRLRKSIRPNRGQSLRSVG